jgi:hypothetical protein
MPCNKQFGGEGIQVLCCDTVHMNNMYVLPPLCPTPTKTIYELHHPPISSEVAPPPLLSFSTSSSFSFFHFGFLLNPSSLAISLPLFSYICTISSFISLS